MYRGLYVWMSTYNTRPLESKSPLSPKFYSCCVSTRLLILANLKCARDFCLRKRIAGINEKLYVPLLSPDLNILGNV